MGKKIGKGIGIAALAICGIFVMSFLTMWLWNALIPQLFHGPTLDYWQTLGLLVLAKIFFGGGHRGGHRGWKRRHRRNGRCAPNACGSNACCPNGWGSDDKKAGLWDWMMFERYSNMSPEEREKMKEEWQTMGAKGPSGPCGPGGSGLWDFLIMEKMANMTPEERQKAKQEWKASFKWGKGQDQEAHIKFGRNPEEGA